MAEFLNLTLGGLLEQMAREHPEVEALVDLPSGQRITYAELNQEADRVAKGLMALGVPPGGHVALWAPNLPPWLPAWLGLAKAGGVLVSIDLGAEDEQLAYVLQQAGCHSLILAPGVNDQRFVQTLERVCPELAGCRPGRLQSDALPEMQNVIILDDQPRPGMFSWDELLQAGRALSDQELAARHGRVDPRDPATLLYTSGTTGPPKGVMSSHYGIINVSSRSAANLGLTSQDRLCLSVPLSHMFGCVCVALTAITQAATLVIPSQDFTAGSLLRAVEQEACTAIFGSPNGFLDMLEHPDFARRRLDSLRTGIMGGAQCPLEVMDRVVGEMGVAEILLGFGQTEASSWATQTRPDDPLELRVSTVGRALPDVELKIVDPETGQDLPPGQVGEFCCRGFNMIGYYNMPAATAGALDPQGWLHTGDMASMDENGYVRISGRLKETINKGDAVIYPTEVEEVLFTHPAVVNAQVFGVPDGRGAEEVAAWVKLQPGSELGPKELIQYCRDRLPPSHLPAHVKLVSDYPLTAVGKVQKFKMRDQYARELGLVSD